MSGLLLLFPLFCDFVLLVLLRAGRGDTSECLCQWQCLFGVSVLVAVSVALSVSVTVVVPFD